MNQNLLEKELSSHIFEQGSMQISLSKEDPIIGRLPTHEEEVEGRNTVISRAYLESHAEKGGAHAPKRGTLASFQEDPQDLMCGDQGTIHVSLLERCETMESQGGDGENNQQHGMRSTHPYPFLEVVAPRREAGLRSQSMDLSVHPYVQSSLVWRHFSGETTGSAGEDGCFTY